MHRLMAITMFVVTQASGVAVATAGTIHVGLALSRQLGEGIVEFTPDQQSFATLASRNYGPQQTGQWFAYSLPQRIDREQAEETLAVLLDEGFQAGSQVLKLWRLDDLVPGGRIARARVTGIRLGGERMFVGANLSTGADSFHPWLYSIAMPRSGVTPVLTASFDLAPGLGGSAEVTDLQFAKLPTGDSANGASIYYSVAERLTGDCHALKLGKATYSDDQRIFNSNFYQNPLSQFTECHTRAARLTEMSSERARFEGEQLLFWGARLKNTSTGPESVGLYQIVDRGSSAALDIRFGGDGQVKIQHASGLNMRFWDLANQASKLLVAMGVEGPQAGAYQPIIVRLNENGTLDTSFGNNGIWTIPASGQSSNPRTISVDARNNIVVTGETYTASSVRPFAFFLSLTSPPGASETYAPQHVEYAFPGRLNSTFFTHEHHPDGTITYGGATFGNYPDVATTRPLLGRLAGPPGATKAIEYFHAGLGHYAVISLPNEIQALDSGAIAGWRRTGFWFNVHATEAPGTLGVDRYFSDAFAPKSSNFYTNSASEVALLRASSIWRHEGRTFFAHWPSAVNRCPPTMRPVKRVYNNGLTGAPNHQYGDDDAVVATAIARGGVIESGAFDNSFFCTE